MNDADHVDEDLDRLIAGLPEQLRADWVVLPRRIVNQISLVSMLFGATAAMVALGFVYESALLRGLAVGVVVGLLLVRRHWAWWRGDDLEAQLRDAVRSTRPEPGGGGPSGSADSAS